MQLPVWTQLSMILGETKPILIKLEGFSPAIYTSHMNPYEPIISGVFLEALKDYPQIFPKNHITEHVKKSFLEVTRSQQITGSTLPKTNSEFTPEKWWLGDYFPSSKGLFLGAGHVGFREGD